MSGGGNRSGASGAGGAAEAGRVAEALARLGPRTLTWPVLCERAGVEHSIADVLWRALGFPDIPPDEPAYTEEDVRALQIAAEGLEALAGAEREQAVDFIVREARAVSGFLGRIAEVQVDALAELEARQLRAQARAAALDNGLEGSPLGWLLMYALRRRLDEAIRRRGHAEADPEPVLAVGFIDLVDFTRASTGLDAAEFGRVLGRFEAVAWDEVTEAGGRLVKLIGDEAMFVAPANARAAEAALAILAQCGDGDLPRARAGIAAGPVLARGGDYFGPVVNLASRLVDESVPDTIILDRGYRSILREHRAEITVAELEPRELKGIGRTDLWAVRLSDARVFRPA